MTGSAVFLDRLRRATCLCDADLTALGTLLDRPRRIAAGRQVVAEGEPATHVHVLMHGWAMRHAGDREGRVASSAFLVAGDVCNVTALRTPQMDHGVTTLTPCRIARVPCDALIALARSSPVLPRVLAWLTSVDTAVPGAASPATGRATGRERLGHLLCELLARLAAVGCAERDGFDLPVTQAMLARATGLTSGYVNRVLQRMRREGLVTWRNGRVTIPDRGMLERASAFSPAYLQLDGVSG